MEETIEKKKIMTKSSKKTMTLAPLNKSFSFNSVLVYAALLILAALFIFPLLLPFMFVFKTTLEFARNPWGLPKKLLFKNFQVAWEGVDIGRGLINTLIVCIGAVSCTVPISAMAGYIFARYRSKITNILFYVVMGGFFIPVQMVLIPLYKISANMGLLDTLPGLFLPMTAFGIPFWTMIYRSFFATLPMELMEAARIDGASHTHIFTQIMIPLTTAATTLAVLLTFMGSWNDFLLALIFLNTQDLFTMQLRIAQFIGNTGANFFPQYAAGVIIASAPTILLYIVFHKKIIEGNTLAGAIKG